VTKERLGDHRGDLGLRSSASLGLAQAVEPLPPGTSGGGRWWSRAAAAPDAVHACVTARCPDTTQARVCHVTPIVSPSGAGDTDRLRVLSPTPRRSSRSTTSSQRQRPSGAASQGAACQGLQQAPATTVAAVDEMPLR
jgi:hypothetical protein